MNQAGLQDDGRGQFVGGGGEELRLQLVQAAGGSLRSPVTEIPVGKVAEITDDDGNVVCVMEYTSGHALAAR